MIKNTEKIQSQITLSKEQFLTLVKMVYLGNWVANSHRVPNENDGYLKEYDELSEYIFSHATMFHLPETLERDIEIGCGCGDAKHEEGMNEIEELVEAYNENTFWNELSEQLGERDFYAKYSNDQIMSMTDEGRFLAMQECITLYEKELEDRGVERLHVMKTIEDFGIHF